ncbi:MAG TPA: DoxX family protein [Kofleriaceae bacterium]|jgi:uncharacterized membrane protein YphA (DoxX/SURF4 family)
MKSKLIGYWVTTIIVALVLLSGGVADLLRPHDAAEGMVQLGYPLYFMSILGFWKVLGGIVLVAPRLPRLKEWAYAGAIFDFTGAAASHIACGDDVFHIITPVIFALIALASWVLRPEGRRLGMLWISRT